MNLSPIKESLISFKKAANKHSPEILIGIAGLSFMSTVYYAAKATPKAIDLAYSEALNHHEGDMISGGLSNRDKITFINDELDRVTILKTTWKCYIPTVVMGSITIACIAGSHHISSNRNAALVSAYSVAEKTMNDYQSKVIDILGEDAANKVRESLKEDNARIDQDMNIILNSCNSSGNDLCFDPISGRYFRSNGEDIRTAMNDYNHALMANGYFDTLNGWYFHLGIPGISIGDMLSWDTDRLLDFEFKSMVAPNNEPCLVINYLTMPGFYDYH